jgi:phosphatidate cytidylyltransferase
MKDVNKNLLWRIVSAIVLAPPLVLAVLWKDPTAVAIIVHVASLIALLEFYWIVLREDPMWIRVIGGCIGVSVSVLVYWLPKRPDALMALLIFATLVSAILFLIRLGDVRSAAVSMALMVFGIVYIPLLLTCLALIKRMPDGGAWVLMILFITFGSDTGAYAAGRLFGKRKLYPSVSPGKTVEGAIGGLLTAFAMAMVAKLTYLARLSWADVAFISIPGGALGQIGDLVESMVKRAYGVKDSGRIIPGHGGLLDRIDALLFVSAHTYLYARYVVYGWAA